VNYFFISRLLVDYRLVDSSLTICSQHTVRTFAQTFKRADSKQTVAVITKWNSPLDSNITRMRGSAIRSVRSQW